MRASRLLLLLALVACGDDDQDVRVEVPELRAPVRLNAPTGGGTHLRVRTRDAGIDRDGMGRFRAGTVELVVDARDRSLVSARATDIRAANAAAAGDGWSALIPELSLDDVVLDEDGISVRVAPTRLQSTFGGVALPPLTISGTLAAAGAEPRGELLVRTTRSRLTVDAPGDGTFGVRADPLSLGDLETVLPGWSDGVLTGAARLQPDGDDWIVSSGGLRIERGGSRLLVSGSASTAQPYVFDDVLLTMQPLHAEDLFDLTGFRLPLDIAYIEGDVGLDGGGTAGTEVDALLLAVDSLGRRATIESDGRVWLGPRPRLALDLTIDTLRATPDFPLALNAAVEGPFDSLRVTGVLDPLIAAVRLDPDSSFDPRVHDIVQNVVGRFDVTITTSAIGGRLVLVEPANGAATPFAAAAADLAGTDGRAWLSVQGRMGRDSLRPISGHAVADSLPLRLLPWPSVVQDVTGQAALDVHLAGTMDAPRLQGSVRAHDFGLTWPEWGAAIEDGALALRITNEAIVLDSLVVRRGEGAIRAAGQVTLAAPLGAAGGAVARDAMVSMSIAVDTFLAASTDSVVAVVDGRLAVSGPLRRPHVAGRLSVIEGHVYEGRLAPNPPLDLEDPPYADLVAQAPWLEESRLLAASPVRAAGAGGRESRDSAVTALDAGAPAQPGLPLTADVALHITPAFRIIDEDSDLGAEGELSLVIDDDGAGVRGVADIREGFYAYYGHRFDLDGGAFRLDGGEPRLAMLGTLRLADRPIATSQGGLTGLDERMPATTILGYSTPATVLELLRRREALPATQAQLGSWLLFGEPLTPSDAWTEELFWSADEANDFVGHRSGVRGSGLLWAYIADELYDWVPLENGYFRATTVATGSSYPAPLMVGSHLQATAVLTPRWELSASTLVGTGAAPGVALRYVFRPDRLDPPRRLIELFAEPRVSASIRPLGDAFTTRSRWGLRMRWLHDY